MRMRTDRFRVAYGALKALAGKRLSNLAVEMKYTYVIQRWTSIYDATESHIKKAQLDFIQKGDKDGKSGIMDALGMQIALAAVHAEEISVSLPKVKFGKDDLPKELDGEKGDENRTGVAVLAAELGPLFVGPKDMEPKWEEDEPEPAAAGAGDGPKLVE